MTDTSGRPSGKAAAAAAAKAMLADRVKLVESLGEAHDQHQRKAAAVAAATAAEQDAADAVRVAYAAALHGGWAASELKAAGLDAPRTPRGRKARTSGENGTHAAHR